MTEITLDQLPQNRKFYLVCKKNDSFNRFKYHDGFNVDYDFDKRDHTNRGGLFFFSELDSYKSYIITSPKYIREVTFEEDDESEEDSNKLKIYKRVTYHITEYSTNKCFLGERKPFSTIPTKYIRPELYLDLLKTGYSSDTIRYIKNPTLEMFVESIKKRPYSLRYIKEQTPELCLLAVKQDSFTIQFVKNQTIDICL